MNEMLTMTTTPPPSLDHVTRFRADAYALLGSLLAQAPSADLLNWLQQVELDEQCDTPMHEAWSVLQLAAQRAEEAQVAEEYQNLFIGIGRGELVPFGSWYLTGFLMEKPLVALRQDLAALGIERDPAVKEPEDHVGALCQVMALLVESGESAAAAGFFKQHLQGWTQQFFTDLQAASAAHFYSAVGRFGELFAAQETLLLND
ncbi:molecular chaperone [Motiliproteus sp. SC1-56]|uniref:TorD/DmsD family molecular chaperone n=1 Tax=Motiliproteus sp. SC1-56 TaxID=2799565 RepID=UPI001F5D31E6|nr:molecular chaperone TorD family protein [Motiliproteus sp. SC1-56]